MKRFLGLMAFLLLASPVFAQTHSATLSWGASSTAGVNYNIYRCTGVGCAPFPGTPLVSQYAGGLTYKDSAVTAGTTYQYQITATCTQSCAVGFTGESAPNNVVTAVIPIAPIIPQPPGTLSITTVSMVPSGSKVQINASWKDSPSIPTNYALYGNGAKLLKSGQPSIVSSGLYTMSWSGAKPTIPWFTVCDAIGDCQVGHP